jgi:2-polyprenyl-3-methyl-5-hydroxy-6-metoxy-1,4-benzoquinol methylase
MSEYQLKKNKFGFYEVQPKPTKNELAEYYSEVYFQQGKGSYETSYLKNEIDYFIAKIDQRCSLIKEVLGKDLSGKSFLDIGCGEGFALSYFNKHGLNVTGLDFSEAGVTANNPSVKNKLITGDVFDEVQNLIRQNITFDIVWMQNVLEHVIDPFSLKQNIKKLTNENGIVVITVPNDFSAIQNKAVENKLIDEKFWVCPPDHLNYFNAESLTKFFSEEWDIYQLIGDFPVDLFLYNKNSNYIKTRKVGKEAHLARVALENLINEQPNDHVNQFFSALARIGLGRDLTIFLTDTKK